MRLLVTGGAGFIGSALVRYLIRHTDADVINVDKLTYAASQTRHHPIRLPVHDPERYGAVELNESGQAISLEEKPAQPKSHNAVTGLYSYAQQVLKLAGKLHPSFLGELGINDLNNDYLERRKLVQATLDEKYSTGLITMRRRAKPVSAGMMPA